MNLQKIRSVIGWCGVINFSLLLLSSIIFFSFNNSIVVIWNVFFPISTEDASKLMIVFLAFWKISTIVFFVVPYVAIKIVEKDERYS